MRKRRNPWFTRLGLALASVCASLMVGELAAANLHDHAYPFLNIFVADPRYGVRLRASVSTRVRSRMGRVTEIRTNRQGFRGTDWLEAEPGNVVAGRVLVLGDSQVLGLGVDEEHTFTARLSIAESLNSGVPTWGPTEFNLAAEDLVPRYRPEQVVIVANLANDWFEATVLNHRRTTARDGWSARVTSTQIPPRSFPGREFTLGASHLVLAVRELFHHVTAPRTLPADSAMRLLRNLSELAANDGPYRSRITRHVLATQRTCRLWSCKVTVLVLPMDLQVHEAEWHKYRSQPVDLSATARLTADLLADAREHGFAAVDLLPALQAASFGAFLEDDYHLSPKGHGVVAHVLRTRLGTRTAEVMP
jgi:hypothetical protein